MTHIQNLSIYGRHVQKMFLSITEWMCNNLKGIRLQFECTANMQLEVDIK